MPLPPLLPLDALDSTPRCLFDIKAQLGEGPIWVPETQRLYFTDIKGCRLYRYHPATGACREWVAPGPVGFLLPVEGGTFLAGMRDGLHSFDPATGGFSHLCVITPGQEGNRLNDGCVDRQGRIWFGTMDDWERHPSGAIYRVAEVDGKIAITCCDTGYVVSNGPTVSPDGRFLYVCDSPARKIYVFDKTPDGTLHNKRLFAQLDHGYPDGIVTDCEGNLWCGLWGGGRIARFRPDGQALPSIPMPVTNVTKIAFGGDDLKTAFVTTARRGLSEAQLAKEPQAGGVFAFRSDVAGVPQGQFRFNPRHEDETLVSRVIVPPHPEDAVNVAGESLARPGAAQEAPPGTWR
ncbi:SMP-30/gluconolactonase/LRE family protein [Formicincola oecophyllae]|uniref:SMP-30/gluconolactonase/LRE family protein n=1 Tax=Formicincola oecophyllae TaxID=2558361 RepID=A0A4Y6UCN1_9PROT|nr:SMP-30/gluconolactonase/LRE family protein [Formicincola oecophyllae]QDH13875.1 SMP-30/gluconolactonase/LRE family protein [Formicincola oecophyllae]